MISQRRRIVKHECYSSFIYMCCIYPLHTTLRTPFCHSFPPAFFRPFVTSFYLSKSGKLYLLWCCVPLPSFPFILCLIPPFTALFGGLLPLGKFHLPILFIYLHFVNIFPSRIFTMAIVILHNFSDVFSTSRQVAQTFRIFIIFSDFLPFYG